LKNNQSLLKSAQIKNNRMRKNIVLQIGMLLFFTTQNWAANIPPKISPVVKSDTGKWNLVWSDEFNYTGLPDRKKWNYEVGGDGWGNNEKQFYVEKSLKNSFVENGKLHIVALHQDFKNSMYTSARLTTYQRFMIQYGKIEVMAKLPKGKGTWPAIWMLPVSLRQNTEAWPLCGEIDIMEHVGKNPNFIHVSLHSELYNHIKSTQITHFEKFQDVFDTFHKYAIEWSENQIAF
jgi:beta-glucanase (GH16 family)